MEHARTNIAQGIMPTNIVMLAAHNKVQDPPNVALLANIKWKFLNLSTEVIYR